MRSFFSVFAGLATGIMIISLLEAFIPQLNIHLFGQGPAKTDGILIGLNMFFVLLVWSIGAFAAGMLSSILSKNKVHTTITSVLLMVTAAIQFFIIQQPWWFIMIALALFIPLGHFAHQFVNRTLKR